VSIVVGYDGGDSSGRALEAAITLAQDLNEPLVIVCGVAPAGGVGEEYRAVEDAVVEVLAPAVEQAVELARSRGVTADSVLVDAGPVDALEAVAEERSARMIVVGYGSAGHIRAALFGAVAHRMFQRSTAPVLVVHS